MDQINFKATLICKEDLKKALQCVSDTELELIMSTIEAHIFVKIEKERTALQVIRKLLNNAQNWTELMKRREKNDIS